MSYVVASMANVMDFALYTEPAPPNIVFMSASLEAWIMLGYSSKKTMVLKTRMLSVYYLKNILIYKSIWLLVRVAFLSS